MESPSDHAKPPSKKEILTCLLLCKRERTALKKFYTKYNSKHKATSQPSTTLTTIPTHTFPPLPRPLALPQISPWPTSSILRAYAPSLTTHGISSDLFLCILDAYNLAITPSPSMQALDAAGGILGLVPEPHVQIASQAIAGAAVVGEMELSRARGEAVVGRVNSEVLEGRGLRMDIVKGSKLGGILGLSDGEVLPVLLPGDEDEDDVADDVDEGGAVAGAAQTTSAERRVRALGGLVADVTFDVPAPKEQAKKLHRYLAKEQKRQLEKYRKEQKEKREQRVEEKKAREVEMGEKKSKVEEKVREGEVERTRLESERDEGIARATAKAEEKITKRPTEEKRIRKDLQREVAEIEDCEGRVARVLREANEAHEAFEQEAKRRSEEEIDREREKMEKLQWTVIRSL